MGEILNPKLTKAKNADFRLKLEAWKARKAERVAVKKRNSEHGQVLRDYLH